MISWAHLAHNLGNFYATSRHATPTATPSPRSEQLHAMSNHTPNGIRADNNRHTIANEPGNLHAHEQPHPNDIRAHNDRHTLATIWATLSPWATAPRTTPRAHTDRHTITPPGVGISLLSRG